MFTGADFIVADAQPTILWSRFCDDHDSLIELYGINDWNKLTHEPRVARVTYAPVTHELDDIMNPDGWVLRVTTSPEWFDAEKLEPAMRAELRKWHTAKVIGEGTRIVGIGEYYVFGTANVTACDTASLRAYHTSQITGKTKGALYGYDQARVETIGCVYVALNDNAHGVVKNTTSVKVYNEATCRAERMCTVKHESQGLLELGHYSVGHMEAGHVALDHAIAILKKPSVIVDSADPSSLVLKLF